MWQVESCSNRGQGSSTTIKPSATLWGHGYPHPSLFIASSVHSVWIFPNGWECRTQHETEFTSASLPSNLMHAWSSGANQFTAFTVWWICDLEPLCCKCGHTFSSVYKTYGHNLRWRCIKHQIWFDLFVWTVLHIMQTCMQKDWFWLLWDTYTRWPLY